MAERWNKPVIPIALEPVDQGLFLADGRRLGILAPVLSPEDVERARQGYICLRCLQWFEKPWPEKCFVCGAPIRTKQAEYFAREFGGEIQLGPSTSLDDELEALREKETRDEH